MATPSYFCRWGKSGSFCGVLLHLIVAMLAYIVVIMFCTGLKLFCRISCPSKLFEYSIRIITCSYLVLLGNTKKCCDNSHLVEISNEVFESL